METEDDGGTALLATHKDQLGRHADFGECQISLVQVGRSRARLLDLRPSDPLLVLTQNVRHGKRAFYLAK
ncbi:hypothetical protein [Pseudarthrobacter oxydans]|uniref:hypothetical protein n=1 Tax=Pseudarthrobacter oxydans TaxID=1671 RepID=UPI00342B7873